MARFWHKPGVLMTAYVVLFVTAQALATSRAPASPWLRQVADAGNLPTALFLAWRVTRGGWLSRGLIVLFTAALIRELVGGPDLRSGGLVSLGLVAICLVQIALLVSTPIYERTRKDGADRPPSTGRLWPTPPRWISLAAVTAGLVITLLFLGSEDFQSVPCGPASSSAPPARCVNLTQGFPVHFLSARQSGGFAAPVIDKGAAAEDLAIWTVLSFAACYLIWLPSRRPAITAAAQVAAPV